MAPPSRDPGISTAHAVSPDSGEHWTAEGAWEVAPGVHRIPLPLPMDGLRAINVYTIQTDDGLTLIDGGWHIPVARELLDASLRSIGSGFGDIKRFLVTHVHRDHFTMATVLGRELGIDVALGLGDQPALELLNNSHELTENPFHAVLRSAGAGVIAEEWERLQDVDEDLRPLWQYPTTWLDGDHEIPVGARTLDAVHTPGHTPGHFVFADRADGLLFAGDHVLPTITPSIGFTVPPVPQPLGDFMASLTKVRALPDLRVLPAHGPVTPSTHERVDELLAHHETRLADSLALVADGGSTAYDVARGLGWTRHLHAFDGLDWFSRGMAAMETKAHLDLLVARGDLVSDDSAVATDGVVYRVVTAC
ncbi:MBL fold metallo-hydrolase [Nocardioides rubriscoriae]|uniref:MBL fold metallo-hydrolase n=1 Tax=Nocardioides rubriscoriae TaxID=642762 RepID=UPI0011DF948C|nr:MBL fold metallo-hydrolase [Nocardioides rubriscoriae]